MAVLPVALLLIASQVTIPSSPGRPPVADAGIWEPRYLLFCLPGAALLLVATISRLSKRAAVTVVTTLLVGAAASQAIARPAVSTNDLRSAAELVGQLGRRGDAVLFPDIAKRLITAAYPADFRRVLDIGLDSSPAARDSLYGLNVSEPVLWAQAKPCQPDLGHHVPLGGSASPQLSQQP